MAGVWTFAVAHSAAAGCSRPRRGRRFVERTARAPLQKSHRRGQLGKNRRIRRGQGEKERPEESRVPPGRFAKSADRTNSVDLVILSQALHHAEIPADAI